MILRLIIWNTPTGKYLCIWFEFKCFLAGRRLFLTYQHNFPRCNTYCWCSHHSAYTYLKCNSLIILNSLRYCFFVSYIFSYFLKWYDVWLLTAWERNLPLFVSLIHTRTIIATKTRIAIMDRIFFLLHLMYFAILFGCLVEMDVAAFVSFYQKGSKMIRFITSFSHLW